MIFGRIALEDDNVTRVVERITGHTMLGTAGESFGAGFIAIDPEKEDEGTFSLIEALAEGSMFETGHDKGIILGERLATNLGAKMGNRVVYTLTDKNGEIVSGLARLSGILRSGAPSIDGGMCLLPIDAVREVLGYAPDEATQVAVFVDDQRRSDRVAERLQQGRRLGHGGARLVRNATGAFRFHRHEGRRGALHRDPHRHSRRRRYLQHAFRQRDGTASRVRHHDGHRLQPRAALSPRHAGKPLARSHRPGRGCRRDCRAVLLSVYHRHRLLGAAWLDEGSMEIAGVALSTTIRVGIFPESAAIIAIAAVIATLLSGIYPAWKAGHVEPVKAIKIV